jgi:hypothetical protein
VELEQRRHAAQPNPTLEEIHGSYGRRAGCKELPLASQRLAAQLDDDAEAGHCTDVASDAASAIAWVVSVVSVP